MLVNFHEKSVNSPHIVLSDANFERKCGDYMATCSKRIIVIAENHHQVIRGS
jgi:hypothetical protein